MDSVKWNDSLDLYNKEILDHLNNTKDDNTTKFDLIQLGLRDVGHTGSILNPNKINNNDLLAITKGKKYKRIKVTYKILNNVDNILFLLTGKRRVK